MTQASEEDINTILRIKDFYQILGVSKDADEGTVKNAYRKLAIRFHPDKCKHPHARQAFNKVSTAYTTLVDQDKRASYDRYGSEQEIMRNQADRQREYHQQRANFEGQDHFDEFDFIFRQFFGGMPAQGGRQFYYQQQPRHQYAQRPQAAQQQGFRFNIMHIFLIMFLASTFLPKLFESKPYFSLNQTYEYNSRRHTAVLRVLFFVRSEYFDYIKNNDARRQSIDQQVQQLYIKKIYNQCENQQALARKYLQLARGVYNREAYAEAARNVDMTSCRKMEHYQSQYREHLNSLF